MRCPNCGMDIVIATHLCPHCGYEHDFDGAIEKRRDIPEPWELTPGRAWKRRQRRERAASVWAENRAGREKVPEREFAVRESSARRSGSGGALMHVLCLVSFGIMALLLFGSALLLYTGIYSSTTSSLWWNSARRTSSAERSAGSSPSRYMSA